jgi:peptidoglycan-N-acetylmuramic acid deacetylase
VVGLVLVALAFFPLSLREFQALQCAHEQLKQRFADVAAQVSDDSLVNQQLGDELRYVKDSVLTSLAGRHGSHVIDVRIAPILYFDNKLPVSLDDGPTDQRLVCLTFDGGAYANAAGDILDTLRSRGVTATMFLTGRFMENNPDLVRRILAQGHEIGNHTYTHPHLTSWEQNHVQATLPDASRGMLMRELGRTERVYRKITGRDMPALWRAPYGERNRQICQWGQEAGYLHIGWRQGGTWLRNLDSNDWVTEEDDPAYHSPADVYRKIVAAAESGPSGLNGGIILMHLGTTRRDPARQVHRVLGSLIDTLRDMGYQFVKVTDMARAAGVDFALLDHLGDTQALPDRVGAATP